MITLQDAIARVKKEYPKCFPDTYVEYEGKYYFVLKERGTSNADQYLDIHSVDKNTGKVSGAIPPMSLFEDEGFRNVFEHLHKVSNQDNSLEHGESFLSHHGIRGQKWGVKNGPPYPLDQEKHDRVVGKIGKRQRKSSSSGNEKEGGILSTFAAVAVATAVSSIIAKKAEEKAIDADYKRTKKLIDENSKALISDFANVDKKFTNDNPPKTIQGKHTMDDDIKAVNPMYDQSVPGTVTNCALCSVTYDLRRRGYDVTSKTCETGIYGDRLLSDIYGKHNVDTHNHVGENFALLENSILKKYPEGSRGEMTIRLKPYYGGLSHAMSFEVKNGKVIVIDAQSGKKYDLSNNEQMKVFGLYQASSTTTVRLDNLKVNWENANIASAEMTKKRRNRNSGSQNQILDTRTRDDE